MIGVWPDIGCAILVLLVGADFIGPILILAPFFNLATGLFTIFILTELSSAFPETGGAACGWRRIDLLGSLVDVGERSGRRRYPHLRLRGIPTLGSVLVPNLLGALRDILVKVFGIIIACPQPS